MGCLYLSQNVTLKHSDNQYFPSIIFLITEGHRFSILLSKRKESHTQVLLVMPALFLLHLEVLYKGGQAPFAFPESCSATEMRWKVTKSCHRAEMNALIWCLEGPLIKKEVPNTEIMFWGPGLLSDF